MCLGYDSEFKTRMYEHGYQLFGAFYDLVGIYMFDDKDCKTDAELISVSNRLIKDFVSIGGIAMGFEGDYYGKTEHMTSKTYQDSVNEYMNNLYQQYYDSLDSSAQYWTEIDYFGG
jgi:hypothetical protein